MSHAYDTSSQQPPTLTRVWGTWGSRHNQGAELVMHHDSVTFAYQMKVESSPLEKHHLSSKTQTSSFCQNLLAMLGLLAGRLLGCSRQLAKAK